MKKILIGLFVLLFVAAKFVLPDAFAQVGGNKYSRMKSARTSEAAEPARGAKAGKVKKADKKEAGLLTIGGDEELTFPEGMKECRVFTGKSLEDAVWKANWRGECEWIVLRPPNDWESSGALWLQLDKPLVIENKSSAAVWHPLVITNDTGRAVVFKTPKNGGCAVIIRKGDVAILGITFEGAVCR